MYRRKKKLFITILYTGVAFGINYLIMLFLTPFITKNIGTEAYGFVTLAKTFASFAIIVTTALNSYSSRFIAIEYHRKNYKKANEYFSSVFFADLVLGAFILLIAILFAIKLQYLLNVSEYLIADVKCLLLLVTLNLIINTSGSALQAAAYIKNKLDIVGIFKGLSYVMEAITLLLLYTLFTSSVIYVGIGLIISSIVIVISNFFITFKFAPELQISKKQFSISAVKELVINGIWNSLNSLGNTLNSGLDLIICNLMLSPLAMGQVSIVKTIMLIFSGLYQLIAQPFQPIFLKNYAENDNEKLINELKFSMKISGFMSNLAFAGFVALGMCYYKLWIPEQDIEFIYNLTIIGVLSCVLEGPLYPLYFIYTLTIKNKVPCLITIIGGICNVTGMYLLIKYTNLGAYAVLWTTAVVMLFINAITNPVYMCRCLKISWTTFYPSLIRHVISCLTMTAAFSIISKFLAPYSWLTLICAGLICCAIGGLIHFAIVLGRNDHIKIKKLLIEKFGKSG